jgi:hypothetical protein
VTVLVNEPAQSATEAVRKVRVSGPGGRVMVGALNLLASIQFVWFYLSQVSSCLNLTSYEAWRERQPFQYRLLMVYPLRWAHANLILVRMAEQLTQLRGWFPHPVHPEGVAEAAIDLLCVAITGLMARRLYQASSRTGLLTPVVYPLTLAMAAASYVLLTNHRLRFVYDLPSMAFFSVGLYLIYYRRDVAWFIALFCIATLNRETTLLLLVVFAIDRTVTSEGKSDWRKLRAPGSMAVLVSLLLYWSAWQLWVAHRFAANPIEDIHQRLWLNLTILLFPLSWPQLLVVGCYLVPLVLLKRGMIDDPRLRSWYWMLPVWFAVMLWYGLFVEARIFGELIPYFACLAALIWEKQLLERLPCGPVLGER